MLASLVRTLVPLIVGYVLAQAARVGLELPAGALADLVAVLVTFGYYSLARLIERFFPVLGGVLVSGGLTRKAPEYRDR